MAKVGYVDGFVLVVPKAKAAAYKKMATEGKAAWLKFGALDYKECIIDDANPSKGKTSFASAMKPKAGEQVWFSYIGFKNKAHRNAVNKKVMAHFDKVYAGREDMPMPMDPKRMAYAGFKVMVG